MRTLLITLALWTLSAFGAPALQSSQFTAYSGATAVVAIPAGALGERIYVFIGAPAGSQPLVPSGWMQISNQGAFIAGLVISKVSNGTETSVSLSNPSGASGEALVIRVSGATFPIPHVGTSTVGNDAAPDAGAGPVTPLPSVPFLHLTFAVVSPANVPVLTPSGYSNTLYAANGVGLMLAEKSDNGGAVENAGPWVLTDSPQYNTWRAQTFSIR